MKKVLSIAGSDCSGGAGVQADLKTCSAHGVFGMSVIVSVVAENTSRVIDFENVSPEMIGKQMDAVFEDVEVDAVKIGMLPDPKCMEIVAKKIRQYGPRYVVTDPVMYAKNGCPLMEMTAIDALIQRILPLADVLTPNIPEAEKIADMKITSVKEMEEAARKIQALGCGAVVVKGGHAVGSALDVLFDGRNLYHFDAPRIATSNTHGTGCTFSSAIASHLALGVPLKEAVGLAKEYVSMAIAHSPSIGKGHGPTHHFYDLYRHGLGSLGKGSSFGEGCGIDYSLYLVTDRTRMGAETLQEAVEQAVLGGVTMVQLREKDAEAVAFYQLAVEVKKVTEGYGIPLIINDRIDIAMAVDAAGVHVGQTDLPVNVARKILGKDKLLGVSVSSLEEAVKAEADGADYLGVGAMLPTKTKEDAAVVSLDELSRIRKAVHIPVVAIGGIRKENAALFWNCGVDGLAVVSAVIAQKDIRQAALELKQTALFGREDQ